MIFRWRLVGREVKEAVGLLWDGVDSLGMSWSDEMD